MEDFKKLGKDIFDFIEEYAAIRPEYDDEDDKFTSPDASMLSVAGQVLSKGEKPRFVVFSQWGSGGYKPYNSKKGRELHDSLISRIDTL